MKHILVALSVALAVSGCLQSTAKVSSGKLAVIPALTVDQNGTVVPQGVAAHVGYVGSFYNYDNPQVPMGQSVFALGDGGIMIYGTDFFNDPATKVIFRNAATLQDVELPASQFTITSTQMQMKDGFKFPTNLLGGLGQFFVIVKNANSPESSLYSIIVTGQRPQLEYRIVTNVSQNGTLLSSSPVTGGVVTEAIVSTNNIYGNGIIPYVSFIEVKNPSSKGIVINHSNFINSETNEFYMPSNSSSLDMVDFTTMLESNSYFMNWPNGTKYCGTGVLLNPGEKCYMEVFLNPSLNSGPVHDNPVCYNFFGDHFIEYTETVDLGLPKTIQPFKIHARAYLGALPGPCGIMGGGNQNQSQ